MLKITNNSKVILLVSLVFAITLISFYPSLKNDFTNWDDDDYLIDSPLIRDFSFNGIARIFTSPQSGLYLPLVPLSFAFEYHFFKLNPLIYHITNLALHLINCILVFIFIFLISRNYIAAFIASLLFGIHPLHVESVAWACERKDVLYSFFFLGAAIFYALYLKKKRIAYYWLCLVSFIFSILSKPMAASFPLVMILLDYFIAPQNIKKKSFVIGKIPFFMIAFLDYMINMHFVQSVAYLDNSFRLFDKIFIASYSFIFYIYKTFLPIKLSCFYPYFADWPPVMLLAYPLIFSFILILVFLSLMFTKKIIFGFLFFTLTVFPALQLMHTERIAAIMTADRYTYIPSIGLFYIIGEFIVWFYNKKLRSHSLKVSLIISLIFIAAFLSFLSWGRCRVWKDGVTLWTDALSALGPVPQKATAYLKRGDAYGAKGDYDRAISDYTRAIELRPDFAGLYVNRGNAYQAAGDYELAILDHARAIELRPDFGGLYVNRGNAYQAKGDYVRAISDYTKAVEIDPGCGLAYINRAFGYYKEKKYSASLADVYKAEELGYRADSRFLESLKKASNK